MSASTAVRKGTVTELGGDNVKGPSTAYYTLAWIYLLGLPGKEPSYNPSPVTSYLPSGSGLVLHSLALSGKESPCSAMTAHTAPVRPFPSQLCSESLPWKF